MSDGAERLRLFLAVSVPPEVLGQLDAALEAHRASVPGARWAPIENQHVTLKFLGHVEAGQRSAIEEICRSVAASALPSFVAVDGIGAFPRARRARVLWVGLDDPEGLLARLALSLNEGLEPLGYEAEERAFTPHLTLARLKSPAPVQKLIDEVEFRSASFEIGAFHLFRSHLSPRGARYEILETFVLGDEGR